MKNWSHVFEPDLKGRFSAARAGAFKGTWGERVLVELGCGRGIYSVALAERCLDAQVIGIDLKGARLWHGAKKALDLGLTNVRFLRTHIADLGAFFAPQEIDELWITFPDPHPTQGNEKRRLTSPRFLSIYFPLLKSGGKIHLKTDNEALFHYSKTVFEEAGLQLEQCFSDVHQEAAPGALIREVRTQYEEIYLKKGQPIFYLSVCLNRA